MKQAACSVIVVGTRILMIRRVMGNLLACPGGTAEKDEPPIITANRETFEETGYIIIPYGEDFIQKIDEFEVHCFQASIIGGEPRSSDEGEVSWYELDYIKSHPELLAFPNWTKTMLEFYGIAYTNLQNNNDLFSSSTKKEL